MFLVRGTYHFWPKRVAFRNDFCLRCQAPRRSIAVRTFDVGHIFWIPILPVGLWKHWECDVCGQHPHVNPRTRRSFKWLGLVCLLAVSLIAWAAPADADFGTAGWIVRVAAPALAILLFVHLRRTPKEPSLRQRLSMIPPAADTICPFCATPLVPDTGARWACPACKAMRY